MYNEALTNSGTGDILPFHAPYLTDADPASARRYLARGDLSEAAWVLRNALRADPADQDARALLARCAEAPAAGAPRGVFVGGTGRSGTSLLRRALDSTPDVASIPGETKCILDERFRLAPHWFHALPGSARTAGVETLKALWRERFYCYIHPVKASLKDDRRRGFCLWLDRRELDRELGRLDALPQARTLRETEAVWGELYAALFDRRALARGKPLWVEKTPRNSWFADYLYSIMPGMKLVNVVRDGRDVALSMQTVSWGEKDLAKALDWWADELAATVRVLDTLPEGSVLTVRYEDLVTEPDRVMTDIADFLHVSPEFGLDIFSSSVGRWKRELPGPLQARALERHRPLLERFGYDVSGRVYAVSSVPEAPSFDMKKRNDGTRYLADLVLPLQRQLTCVTMSEVAEETRPCFFLRHDVDADLDAAMEMARLEHGHGIRASYFLLPPSPADGPANYYGVIRDGGLVADPALLDRARQLREWGHEVGLHNNIAELAVCFGRDVAEVLAEQVAFFREGGVELAGSSAHGGSFFHRNEFVSFEIFDEGGVKPGMERGRTIHIEGYALRLHALRQADFGFAYEAYSLPYGIGLNDSNGRWGGKLARTSPHPELNELSGERFLAAFREMVAAARPDRGVNTLQVLIHPDHWCIC
ncbi:hypothetical protein DND132_2437 [Pseudodesulfovibrio mercurii]|uniref:Sulfotransferase n=1 Tax=Pseudodesulfovibrio mercurii TaxID=641491 RepID=F0JC67_9BACT|nr:sulfotransferase [Pseudodesulfovibrio mercurii]EGB15640.1 hypothetical protein DND132_2437 [Pseudodesulfovibrio mercurii]